jgi:uncharacterized protein (UPF0332 family)
MADADVFMEKAEESLASAQEEFEAKRYNASARSSYYSVLQAGISALLAYGVVPAGHWSYRFVQARFSGILISRRKLFEAKWASTINNNRTVRAEADYTTIRVSSRRAKQSLDRAVGFVNVIKDRDHGGS